MTRWICIAVLATSLSGCAVFNEYMPAGLKCHGISRTHVPKELAYLQNIPYISRDVGLLCGAKTQW